MSTRRDFLKSSGFLVLSIGALSAADLEALQLGERDVPDYVEADHKRMTAKLARVPGLSDVPYPVQMDPALVIEFYSR